MIFTETTRQRGISLHKNYCMKSSINFEIKFLNLILEEDTAKLGAVKEFESQKRICIYIGELNAQSSSLHIDIAASSSPVRKNHLAAFVESFKKRII